jgi:hypothetical protein
VLYEYVVPWHPPLSTGVGEVLPLKERMKVMGHALRQLVSGVAFVWRLFDDDEQSP